MVHIGISLFLVPISKKIPPFMKLFFLGGGEQQRYLKCSSSSTIRYPPIIIKYCLSLAAESQSAYNDLTYDVITDLAIKPKNFMPHERFVTILIDEKKIQEDLIWDKYTGELIGFVDLGDGDVNAATLDKPNELATHVLVFMVKSIVNPLSTSLATFATTAVSSFQLMPIFWTAISYLEKINLKVIPFFLYGLFFLGYNYMTVAWQRNLATTTVALEKYNNNSNKTGKS